MPHVSRFSRRGTLWPPQLCDLAFDLFHHKSPVCTITDFQPAPRDNDDRIEESRRVPVSPDGPGIGHNPILGSSLTTKTSKIAAKSLVLKDFSYKSFKVKDLAGISS